MFYIAEIPISSQRFKRRLYDFFYCDITAFHEVQLTLLFFVSNITKNAEIHPPFVCNVITEQPTIELLYENHKQGLLQVFDLVLNTPSGVGFTVEKAYRIS